MAALRLRRMIDKNENRFPLPLKPVITVRALRESLHLSFLEVVYACTITSTCSAAFSVLLVFVVKISVFYNL